MSAIAVELPENGLRVVSCEMLDKLINIGDGDAALLYLYIIRHGNSEDSETAARALKLSPDRYERAAFSLSSLNTPPEVHDEKPAAAPKYTMAELRLARDNDMRFAAVCQSAEDMLGNAITESQLRCLYTAYDFLGLSAEAIIEMLSYLKEEKETVRTIDIRHEAYKWADMGVVSAQDAQKYLAQLENEKPISEEIYKALSADVKNPSPKAQRVCRFALSHGFPPDAVELAVRRTTSKRGRPSLDYTLGILRRWDTADVHTVSEITLIEPEMKEVKSSKASVNATDEAALAQWEQDWAERVRSYQRHKEE